MAQLFRKYQFKTIPGFRVEIEEEPTFRLFTGPAKAKWYLGEKFLGYNLIHGDVRSYSTEICDFLRYVDNKVSVTANMYRNMYSLVTNGEASRIFKDIYETRVTVFAGSILCFSGACNSQFSYSSYDHVHKFDFKSSYTHRPSYVKEYGTEGWALRYLIHIYLLVKMKELSINGGNQIINSIQDSYLRSDILKIAKYYGFLEINSLDGTLESISDIY